MTASDGRQAVTASDGRQAVTASDGRQAGATWVAATGAFLVLAAAAVFIAVQWRTLPEAVKLALVGALTGAFLAGGRALRRTLPSTGDVLFHLGAFLVPVDVAGLCVRLETGWRPLLVAEGIVGVGFLGSLAGATRSVVLAWAGGVSAVVLALGVAAVSPLPAPLVLAGAAAAAHLLGHRRPAVAWATVAGVAPVLGAGVAGTLAVLAGRDLGAGVLTELGLAGPTAAWFAAASGTVSAWVLAREARRSHDLALVALAGISLISGAGVAWVSAEPSSPVNTVTAPALFLVVQIVAMLAARDVFWRRPARTLALASEGLAALAAPVATAFVLAAPIVDEGFDFLTDAPPWTPQPAAAAAFALLAAGWLVGAWRRQSAQPTLAAAVRAAVADDRTVAFVATATAAAAVVGTASSWVAALVLLAMACALVASGGIMASLLAVPFVAWAPVTVSLTHPDLVLPTAIAGAFVLAGAARLWAHRGAGVPPIGFTAAAALLVVAGAMQASQAPTIGLAAALLVGVFASWAIAAVVEVTSWPAGVVARIPAALLTLVALSGRDVDALPVALAATLLLAVDAIRTDDPRIGLGAAATAPVAVLAAAGAAGLTPAESGVTLAVAAVVLGGLSVLAGARWRTAVLGVAATCIATGVPLASAHPARFAEAVILTGGLVLAGGVVLRRGIVMHAGGAIAAAGIALHLVADGVTATEPFVLPVSVQLAVAGWQLRRRPEDPPSSWIAFGPSIVLLGGAALVERAGGGDAWHALVAGAVGVAAVAVGGARRLAAPLLLGTGLVVTVTVLETLHTLAGVPTWAWLATGGTTLLATGIGLERAATSPTEAGRRLVEVVADRFE